MQAFREAEEARTADKVDGADSDVDAARPASATDSPDIGIAARTTPPRKLKKEEDGDTSDTSNAVDTDLEAEIELIEALS